MRLKEILRAKKKDVSWTDWKFAPIPRKEFPLSKQKKRVYSLGSNYRWRVCRFSIENNKFRVLIAFRADLEKYFAWFGQEQADDMLVLARYEFHGSHPGWHIHAVCKKEDELTPGRVNTPLHSRIPKSRSRHRNIDFKITEQNAADIASKAFKLYLVEDEMFP